MSDLVQYIVVHPGTMPCHETIVRQVALCSVFSYHETKNNSGWLNDDPWTKWFSGPFTKIVRRCKSKTQFDKLVKISAAALTYGDSKVCAFMPMLKDDMPAELAKCQVADMDYYHSDLGWPEVTINGDSTTSLVMINPDVKMSTGKTAAQVAHACMSMYMIDQSNWMSRSLCITDDRTIWNTHYNTAVVAIRDAGRTEIEPNTLTVCAKVIYNQQQLRGY